MDAKKWDALYERIKAQQFELGARLPISWQSTSRTLKRAADRLYDCYHDATVRELQRAVDSATSGQRIEGARELKGAELEDFLDGQLISVYFLLIGYSVENLLKGLLMIKHPEYFKAGSKMTQIRSHDLVQLCCRCSISLEAKETELLEKLKVDIEWQGKYPVPLESEKMWPIRQADGSWTTRGDAFHGLKTQEDVDRLYAKLWDELEGRARPDT
jgi:hypothetical protein